MARELRQIKPVSYVGPKPVLDDVTTANRRDAVRRLVLCSGKVYYDLQGKEIAIPGRRADHPDAELLRWDNENVFEKGIAA